MTSINIGNKEDPIFVLGPNQQLMEIPFGQLNEHVAMSVQQNQTDKNQPLSSLTPPIQKSLASLIHDLGLVLSVCGDIVCVSLSAAGLISGAYTVIPLFLLFACGGYSLTKTKASAPFSSIDWMNLVDQGIQRIFDKQKSLSVEELQESVRAMKLAIEHLLKVLPKDEELTRFLSNKNKLLDTLLLEPMPKKQELSDEAAVDALCSHAKAEREKYEASKTAAEKAKTLSANPASKTPISTPAPVAVSPQIEKPKSEPVAPKTQPNPQIEKNPFLTDAENRVAAEEAVAQQAEVLAELSVKAPEQGSQPNPKSSALDHILRKLDQTILQLAKRK